MIMKRAAKGLPEGAVYRLKITLAESMPPIWREVLIPGGVHLGALHEVIQAAMGWMNCHLHEFVAGGEWVYQQVSGGVRYGDKQYDEDNVQKDEENFAVAELLRNPGDEIAYVYDYGDNWTHRVTLEEILPSAPEGTRIPCCLGGKRACPPEDCGGIYGYEELLAVLADPAHEEHEGMKEWVESMVGGKFDPEKFSRAAANKRLADR